MRRVLIFLSLFFFISQNHAQNAFLGKVTNEKGDPISGATVIVKEVSKILKTNDEGVFKINDIPESMLKINVKSVGYFDKNVSLTKNEMVLIMLTTKSQMMNEVVISSRATDKTPVAYTNVDKQTLAKSNFGQDIPYLLSQTPSAVASSDAGTGIGYTGLRIRGTDATRINVTINSIPYNDADEQITYWVDIPDFTSSVENIQVQRGVGTSTNGSAAFGANINIQTANFSPRPSGEFLLAYGSFNTLKGTIKAGSGLIGKHWAVDARLSYLKSDGYIDRAWSKLSSYFLQAGYFDTNNSLKFITFGGVEHTYHAWDGVPKDSMLTNRTYNPCGFMGFDGNEKPQFYKNQTDNYTQTHYQLIANHVFNKQYNLNAALHYTRGYGYYEEYKQHKSYSEYGIPNYIANAELITEGDLIRQKKMDNNFTGATFALNYKGNKLNMQVGLASNYYWGKHNGNVTSVMDYPQSLELPIEYYLNHVGKLDVTGYFKVNYNIVNKLFLNGELQYRGINYRLLGKNDVWNYHTGAMEDLTIRQHFHFFNPKLGILNQLNSCNDVYASFSIANREPTRTNYTDASLNKLPINETLYDIELGYKYHQENMLAHANIYMMYYHNQLILTGKINEIGEPMSENVPASYRLGVELIGSYKFNKNLRWDGNLTLSQNQIRNFTEYVDNYDQDWNSMEQKKISYQNTPIAYSPSVIWNNSFSVSCENLEVKLSEQFVGKQYLDNSGTMARSLDNYFVSNLNLSYHLPLKPLQSIIFTFLINNLTNTKYISNGWSYSYFQDGTRYSSVGYFPQAGINVLGSVKVKF